MERGDSLDEFKKTIEKLQKTIEEQRKTIEELQKTIEEQRKTIEKLQKTNKDLTGIISYFRTDVTFWQKHVTDLQAKIEELMAENAKLKKELNPEEQKKREEKQTEKDIIKKSVLFAIELRAGNERCYSNVSGNKASVKYIVEQFFNGDNLEKSLDTYLQKPAINRFCFRLHTFLQKPERIEAFKGLDNKPEEAKKLFFGSKGQLNELEDCVDRMVKNKAILFKVLEDDQHEQRKELLSRYPKFFRNGEGTEQRRQKLQEFLEQYVFKSIKYQDNNDNKLSEEYFFNCEDRIFPWNLYKLMCLLTQWPRIDLPQALSLQNKFDNIGVRLLPPCYSKYCSGKKEKVIKM